MLAEAEGTINIGFSGTASGMTPLQMVGVANFLGQYSRFVGHHGVCVGADTQFDGLARAALGFDHMEMYPMINAGAKRGIVPASPGDRMHAERPPLDRNRTIAEHCCVLLATPKEDHMVQRSGTWATVRYALELHRQVYIVIPNGAVIPWV